MRTCTKCGSLLAGADQIIPVPPPAPLLTRSHTEQSVVRTTWLEMKSDLSQLDREVDRVQALLNNLQRKRDAFDASYRRYSHQHMSLLSPIQRLPFEMLSEIFVLYLPEDRLLSTLGLKRTVMRPGSICKRWREIALSTPRLWSSIGLNLSRTAEGHVELARKWLLRSGNVPLSIRLHGHSFLCVDDTLPCVIVDMLIRHVERWEVVDFDLPLSLLRQILPARNRLTSLRNLSIRVPSIVIMPPMPMDLFESASRMTKLAISHDVILAFAFPWTQLTSLTVSTSISLEQCYDILNRTPNLVECHFVEIFGRRIDPPRATIHLANLRKLDITKAHKEPGTLFDYLSLPALRNFSYYDSAHEPIWPHSQFLSLLSRSSCPLEKLVLVLRHAPLGDCDLIECLRRTPSLMHLELGYGTHITNRALEQLTLPWSMPQADFLLPNLETLHFAASPEFSDTSFIAMIESRRYFDSAEQCNGGQQTYASLLKKLVVRFSRYPGETIIVSLRKWAKGGLDIRAVDSGTKAVIRLD